MHGRHGQGPVRLAARSLATAFGALLAGCATLAPDAEWAEVSEKIEAEARVVPVWQRSEADAAAARAHAEELAADGLSRIEAVEIAMTCDPRLQARFDELGIARASFVQAGLPSNPQLSAYAGFPLSLEGSAITLLTFLSDLWIVPAREAVAETQLRQAVAIAGAAAIDTGFQAALAYDAVLYEGLLVDLEQRARELREKELARLAEEDTGKDKDVRVRRNAKAAAVGVQQIAFAGAIRDRDLARNALRQFLCLPADAPLVLVDTLDEPAEGGWSTTRAVEFARDRRIDLLLGRLRVEEAERRLALAKLGRFTNVGVGPGYNGDFSDNHNWGPSLALEIPVFDRQQAAIAGAEWDLARTRHALEALEVEAAREVADALVERAFQQQQSDILQTEVAPARLAVLEASEPGASRDLAEYLHWLQAREQALTARRDHLQAVWKLRKAHIRLQRALVIGGAADSGSDDAGGSDDDDGE